MGWASRNNNAAQGKIKTIIQIGIDEKGRTMIGGLLNEKELCFACMGDAIRILATLKPSNIVMPDGSHVAVKPEEEPQEEVKPAEEKHNA